MGDIEPRLPSDADLLSGIAAGREDAFLALFRRWAPRLERFLRRATGSRETAEDLLQEAFLRVLRAAGRFEPRARVGSWLYRICANLVYSHWRRERPAALGGGEPDGSGRGFRGAANESTEASRNGEEEQMLGAFARDARAEIGRLPHNQRIVFLMKIEQGLTYVEIADLLSCPVGTVKSRFHHAVRALRDGLRAWDEPIDAPTK